MSWSRPFDAPIALPDGREITTLRQAGEYITALPAREHNQPHWQTAMRHLISAAEDGGIVMLAEIAMRQALAQGQSKPPKPPQAPRRKRARVYR
jgi:hypothetical protein